MREDFLEKIPPMLLLHLAYDPSWIVWLAYVDPDEYRYTNIYLYFQEHILAL